MSGLFRAEYTPSFNRRQWLRWAALSGLSLATSSGCQRSSPELDEAPPADPLLRFPGKVAMRAVNHRPPCLETPWRFFQEDLTPNQAFFVRWHLQGVPTADLQTWRLKVWGHVERPVELSMNDLQAMETSSIVAVNQCSGNSRNLFNPLIPGAQWGNGAMGNARWTGVPLQKVLQRVGVKAKAVDVAFAGLDRAGMPGVSNFAKSLSMAHASRPEILLAYEMNDEPLPMLNGFPLRLIVPGWYATYWVKALSEVTVLPHRFDGFWMAKAYRIPNTPNALETPDHLAGKDETAPINRMNVRSFITSPEEGARLAAGQTCSLEGIAFDGGDGIRQVDVSTDGGQTWSVATLDKDWGRFSFRRWRLAWLPTAPGRYVLQVRATNNAGETQPKTAGWNRGGYMRNVIEQVSVVVVG